MSWVIILQVIVFLIALNYSKYSLAGGPAAGDAAGEKTGNTSTAIALTAPTTRSQELESLPIRVSNESEFIFCIQTTSRIFDLHIQVLHILHLFSHIRDVL